MRRYPELSSLVHLLPGPQVMLGHPIHWTEKRDGSNLRIAWLDGKLAIGTRNQEEASEQFQEYFKGTLQAAGVEQFLREHSGEPPSAAADFRFDPVVFGELLIKGRSPARVEIHDKNEFVVFDIWDSLNNRFLPYTVVYQHCYHFDLPCVECWAYTQHTNLDTLFALRDDMLVKAKEMGREGVVLKAFDGDQYLYAKEKLDIPIIPRIEREVGHLQLPCLPDSEVLGAINKAHADLGDAFTDKAQAMPLIARYVVIEQEKHMCSKPVRSLFAYYQMYLEGLLERLV